MQSQKGPENWDRLLGWGPIANADLYLLCEAVPPPAHINDSLEVRMNGSTKETGCQCEGNKCDYPGRQFSTAVAAPRGVEVEPLPFEPEFRAGTWVACRVDLAGMPITAIALYGLKDEAYSSYWESTQKAVSEVIPILEDSRRNSEHVLLGGDFNILAGKARYGGHEVLERIEEAGLVDCLKAKLPEDRYQDPFRRKDMDACECGQGPECVHTRTFLMRSDRGTPHQDDYLFASEGLAGLLLSCRAEPLHGTSPSDHAPIVAEFKFQ
jgi:exonuclease III